MTGPQLPAEHPDDPPEVFPADGFEEPEPDPNYVPPEVEDDDGDPA